MKDTFFEISRTQPDLYGPFWIYTTLIFMIAAAGNFSRYMAGDKDYDFDFVPIAAGLIYTIGFCYPFIMCFMMRTFGAKIEYF